jgi:biopolymer transport protein ExbD
MASQAVRQGDGDEAFDINLTPMIDVVFQLIIFFMCAMKFKTLEKKIEAFLPKDRGLEATPQRIEERQEIKVTIKQELDEGVPHFVMFGEDIGRTASDNGVPRLKKPDDLRSGTEIEAWDAKRAAFWNRHIKDKLVKVQEEIERLFDTDKTLPGQIDAGPNVRHEYVVAVLNCFMAAGMTDITFVGTPPPRSGD